jgi:hypothetical protein
MIGVSFTLLCLLTFYPQDNDRGKFYIIVFTDILPQDNDQ